MPADHDRRGDAERDIACTRLPATGTPGADTAAHFERNRLLGPVPLQRDKALGDYIEFDLSKLQNSKGGFLVEDKEGQEAVQTIEDLKKEREREKQRLRDQMEPGIGLDPTTRPVCGECQSPDIAFDPFQRAFNVSVCRQCERAHPEKYSLLTKTEVKEDYLLTDAELGDAELLPHLLKKNPHKATYSNMMLFLRCQVEAYAFSDAKWKSPEGLDAEYERRTEDRAQKRARKFQQGLVQLRKRTIRGNLWQQRRDAEHVHEWTPVRGSLTMQECHRCGQRIEVEEL
ncbi:DNA repair protein rad14 [Malassezia sp. CBS 17886]|nr:DNA repair protein rad14 [Malassezia sp. CBS 17886]